MDKQHKPYCMIYNTAECTDGVEYDTFEKAYDAACECMSNWKAEEMHNWKLDNGIPHPTEEQIESWDMMIEECCAYVAEWNEDANDFYNEKMDYDYPSEEDVEWLSWEEMKKKYNW